MKLTSPFRRWMWLAGLLSFFTIASAVGLMMTSAFLITMAALHSSIAELQVGIVGVRFFGISRGVFRYLERLISHEATFRLLARLRVWFYRKLEPLAPARLIDYRSSDILSRIINDIEVLEHFFIRTAGPFSIAVIVAFIYSWILWVFHPRLIAPFLLPYILTGFLLPFIYYSISTRLNRKETELRSEIQIRSIDLLQGFAELKMQGRLAEYQDQLEEKQNRLTVTKSSLSRILFFQENLIGFGMNLAILGQIYLAVPLLRNGDITGVQLTVIVLGTMAVFEAVMAMPSAFTHFRANLLSAERLFEMVNLPIPVETWTETPDEQIQWLSFDRVTFRYADTDLPALKDFSFHLEKGQVIYFLGQSGAGKSTIINLLMRFWSPQEGRILVNNHDISTLSATYLTDRIGIMPQRPYLFNATIRQNLELAATSSPSAEAIIRACRQAGIDTKIDTLPQGYDTWIGEQGQQLSTGEQQRLTLAMILLRQPDILILDEATMALDAETEQFILQQLEKERRQRITIFITHKPGLIPPDGQVIILNHGQIVESGLFARLRQQSDSLLNRVFKNQFQDEILSR